MWHPLAVEMIQAQQLWGGQWILQWTPGIIGRLGDTLWGVAAFRALALLHWGGGLYPVALMWQVGSPSSARDEWNRWMRVWRWRRRTGWGVLGLMGLLFWPTILSPAVIPVMVMGFFLLFL
ncbi:hypothetical protein [Ferrovum sp.]|uniref:hypothetical protein n=1 Tax=Ferrovum sp. TaxID=2609467 RepID=UPI002639186D|nr:hypothetical protein [Ferrovum sp.]